nr:hypothetical protein [Ammoniphilus oxalaticus]
MRRLIREHQFSIPITAVVVFINPTFTLYQAPLELPFIFPTQLDNYFDKLQTHSTKLSNKHKQLADLLISLHLAESPYRQLPTFEFTKLKKGITCAKCSDFSVRIIGKRVVCAECGHKESIDDAVMRSVNEFRLLFPEQKITTNVIHEWCKVIESKRRIQRVLSNNFKKIGFNRGTYYE